MQIRGRKAAAAAVTAKETAKAIAELQAAIRGPVPTGGATDLEAAAHVYEKFSVPQLRRAPGGRLYPPL